MSAPLRPPDLAPWLPKLLEHLGADRARVEALVNSLGDDGKAPLAHALLTCFPDKTDGDALTAFRQLRKRIRDKSAGIELEVDTAKVAPTLRKIWFATSGAQSEQIALHTETHTTALTGWIPSTGFKRSDLGKLEIALCIFAPRSRALAWFGALAAMPDGAIDYSDIAPLTDEFWKGAVRNPFYRPLKQSTTVRLDADVLIWLRAQGKGYQTRINKILRDAMLQEY